MLKELFQISRHQSLKDQTAPRQGARKVAAILEVLGVYVAGQFLGFVLAKLLGIPLQNPLSALRPDASPNDLWQITVQLLMILLFQYTGWFILAFLVGWWHRRRGLARYGLTLATRPLGFYVACGVVLFAFAELPVMLLTLVNSLIPLGAEVPWREAIYKMNWNSLEFWLLMAVGSYGLVPILEELFYRGYCQTRLEEDLGAPTAILAVAVLFALSHSQYLILNALNIGMLLTSIFSALAWGYVFYRTRSLLATMIAHALVNIPLKGAAIWAAPVVMLIVCIIARREIYRHLVEFVSLMRSISPVWQAALITVSFALFAVGFAMLDIVALLGLVFFVAALVLDWIDKRRASRSTEGIPSSG